MAILRFLIPALSKDKMYVKNFFCRVQFGIVMGSNACEKRIRLIGGEGEIRFICSL